MALCGIAKVVDAPTPVFVDDHDPQDTLMVCVNDVVVRFVLTVKVLLESIIFSVLGEFVGDDILYNRRVDVVVLLPSLLSPLYVVHVVLIVAVVPVVSN